MSIQARMGPPPPCCHERRDPARICHDYASRHERAYAMLRILMKFMDSRVCWTLCVLAWMHIALTTWVDVASNGFTAYGTTRAVLATALAVTCIAACIHGRAWKKRGADEEAQKAAQRMTWTRGSEHAAHRSWHPAWDDR